MHAVKFADGSETEIVGLLAPNGGPFNGSDIQGERFTPKTDFVLPWFEGDRPLLYHHGLDPKTGVDVVGRIKSVSTDELGLWMKAQLDSANKYYSAIAEMVKAGKLGLSSGAMHHLVRVSKTGDIERWPLIEGSLTPTPANPIAEVDFATAKAHYKAIDLDLPDELAPEAEAVKAPLDTASRDSLSDTDFAYIDAAGGRHLPMNDAEHARAALARFGQTTFEDVASRDKAWRKLMARCKELNVDVSAEMPGKAVSYEMLIADLQSRVNRYDPFGSGAQSTVETTMPGEVYVSRKSGDETTFWRVPYALTFDGTPELGESVEIQESDIPDRDVKALPETSLSVQADTVAHHAVTLSERTKDLVERRVKEGRVLSAASRSSLTECVGSMRTAADQLQSFLDATDPARAKAKADLDALMVDIALLDFASAI